MDVLTDEQIDAFLDGHPDWSYDDDGMFRATFEFANFVEAVGFVNELAELAEELQHHPDIDIRYNTVMLAVVTHDADDQITSNDTELVEQVDDLLE